jgi:alpha-amylase
MLWGDSYTTHYTDKIDATVSTNIPDVTKQTADHQSVLNTYLIFTALRNTYPALAQGTMLCSTNREREKKNTKVLPPGT